LDPLIKSYRRTVPDTAVWANTWLTEMPLDATTLEPRRPPDAGGKLRLVTLDHLDGRTLAVRRVREAEAEAQMLSELGGAEVASEAQRQIARRAAVLAAVLEDAEARWAAGAAFDLGEYTTTANAHRRILATLGLERRQRRTLGELLGD